MNIIIFEYWGYDTHRNWYRNAANHTLKTSAYALVRRVMKTKTLGEKRIAYRKYFAAYKRIAHYKNYPKLFSKQVQSYIWSYAKYIALTFGYDLEELESDWIAEIQGNNNENICSK